MARNDAIPLGPDGVLNENLDEEKPATAPPSGGLYQAEKSGAQAPKLPQLRRLRNMFPCSTEVKLCDQYSSAFREEALMRSQVGRILSQIEAPRMTEVETHLKSLVAFEVMRVSLSSEGFAVWPGILKIVHVPVTPSSGAAGSCSETSRPATLQSTGSCLENLLQHFGDRFHAEVPTGQLHHARGTPSEPWQFIINTGD
ncbi:hypothetical protein MMPV_008859 [Pyropia vietnamensis]